MVIEIDFQSGEAFYMQLRNQIIQGIATRALREGDTLPSVRALAEEIGINMHTVNKAYAVLRQEGYISLDRRRGAVIAVDIDHLAAMELTDRNLRIVLAMAACKGITAQEVHTLVDQIYAGFGSTP